MIRLDTPIILHPDTYDGLLPVFGEFDLRAQTVTLHLAPVQAQGNTIEYGVLDETKEPPMYRYPAPLRTVTLRQNPASPDPVIVNFFRALMSCLEVVEQAVVNTQNEPEGLAMQPFQLGTEEWSLAGSFVSLGNRDLSHRRKPKKP